MNKELTHDRVAVQTRDGKGLAVYMRNITGVAFQIVLVQVLSRVVLFFDPQTTSMCLVNLTCPLNCNIFIAPPYFSLACFLRSFFWSFFVVEQCPRTCVFLSLLASHHPALILRFYSLYSQLPCVCVGVCVCVYISYCYCKD